ncbi:MAG: hypothetical protein HYZ83_06340 [Candidatus Omnitrophica bacterium]|nr:hypothetical protein [Candidatus Omnitrophota bacterium]
MRKGFSLPFFIVLACLSNTPLFALTIPSQWGQIQEQTQGKNGKTIVLIQEAHVDYGAQKAIAEILKYLIENDSLRLILVEGGWEDVSLSYMRSYAGPKGRLEVAERYLKEGKISGEEYLNIISDFDIELWGVEDPKLYEENIQAFLGLENKKEQLTAELSKLDAALGKVKAEIYSPQFLDFDKKRRAFAEGGFSLAAYLPFLAQMDSGIMQNFPVLKNFLSLLGENGTFDPEKVAWEKQSLIHHLSKTMTKPEFEILEPLVNAKTSREELELIQTLLRLSSGPVLKTVPNLKAYGKALAGITRENSTNLFTELRQAETHLAEKLAVSKEEKDLLGIDSALWLVKKLFELKLTPEEFESLEKAPELYKPLSYQKYFETKIAGPMLPDFKFLESALPEAKRFYLSALSREKAMTGNAVQKLKTQKDPISAFIIGGFHAQEMSQELIRAGYSVMLVTPKFAPAGDRIEQHKHYLKILKEKWGRGLSQNEWTPQAAPVFKTT